MIIEALSHSPGPWKAIEGNRGWQIHTDHKASKGAANVNHWIANIKCESCPAHEEGNALLIAAAPELLLALDELLEAYSKPDERLCCDGRDCGCMGSTVHQQAEHYARAAIAKATGGQ